MIAGALYRNPRLLILITAVIAVAGLSSYYVLPRMEDPVLGRRVAVISTAYPGADAEQVEFLVTEKIENCLRDILEIKDITSTSRAGISSIVVELRDEVTNVDRVWSQVRDRVGDAQADLPAQSERPDFRRLELKAFAAIIALQWSRNNSPNMAILRRLANELKSGLRAISGTEDVQVFGDPGEEVVVELEPEVLAALGLSTAAIAQQIRESDAKQPAGSIKGNDGELMLDVAEQMDSASRLGQTRIQYGPQGETTSLADIATIQKETLDPPPSIALIDGKRSIVIAVLVRDDFRIDFWSSRVQQALKDYSSRLPPGIDAGLIFSQSSYVQRRLNRLFLSLGQGTFAVVVVVFLLMGWRSTIVVGTALPLSVFMVLVGMRLLGIPIHQMSVTGLIIALGLLIDNAIVIVDEVRSRIWAGLSHEQAITDAVRHLAMPLFGSTLTTSLAFAPIALLPGPPGEFVSPIAISVILAINASFVLAMTVVPALTALVQGPTDHRSLLNYGFSSDALTKFYKSSLDVVLRVPSRGVVLGALLPILGFLLASRLPEQFFPPVDRDQLQIEVEMAALSTIEDTQRTAEAIRQSILKNDDVARVHWFLGESAPTFYYNVVPRRRGVPFYGQALVDLEQGADSRRIIQELQRQLDDQFAEARVLVRQLEQGPPFDAPIEIQLRGPDLAVLQQLGRELRLLLSQTSNVVHTRSDLQETLPKLALRVDEQQSRMAGLSHNEMARQLYTSFEGAVGGAILDGSEELPIRTRLANSESLSLDQLSSLEFQVPRRPGPPGGGNGISSEGGVPLSALATEELSSDVGAIPRLDGQRMNEIKAYITAGTLPSRVIAEYERRRSASDFVLPEGYSMQYGGEAAKRDEAVGNLLANAVMLFALILVTLVAVFQSFRAALMIAVVGGLSVGLGPGALWLFGFPFGFMAIVGTMGLVGLAINDTIVVLAGIRDDPQSRGGDRTAVIEIVVSRTRHVVTTTLTTMAGFTPLVLVGGGFWPPLAITIAAGVGGATILALYSLPSLFLLLYYRA